MEKIQDNKWQTLLHASGDMTTRIDGSNSYKCPVPKKSKARLYQTYPNVWETIMCILNFILFYNFI